MLGGTSPVQVLVLECSIITGQCSAPRNRRIDCCSSTGRR